MSGKTADVIGDLAGVSRSSAQKFFCGKPISVENFQSLCTVLKLDWEAIADSEEIEPSVRKRKRAAFVIEGSLNDLEPTKLAKLQAMVRALQQLTGDASMTVVDIEEGSIRLILEGSEEGITKLKQLFEEEELAEVLGASIRAVEIVESDTVDIREVGGDRLKALLISTVQSRKDISTDLRGADLRDVNVIFADFSDANLSDANLSNANLSFADFSDANLSFANLSFADFSDADFSNANLISANLSFADFSSTDLKGANLNCSDLSFANFSNTNLSNTTLSFTDLSSANLSFANLSFADLRSSDLSFANLSFANLSGAIVQGTRFGEGIGLSEDEKRDLRRRGAIIDDVPGDRSSINSPSPIRQ